MKNISNSIKDFIIENRYVFFTTFLIFVLLFGTLFFVNKSTQANDNFVENKIATDEAAKNRVKSWKPDLKQNDALTQKNELIPIKKENFTPLNLSEAHSAIIVDAESGNILYQKNALEHRAIASTTKLLTAMIVVDRVKNLDEYVKIPKSVLSIEGTKVGCITSVICRHPRMEENEELRVRDLLSAMLMNSANDAATALALHVSGSERQFAELMNLRSKELNLGNSHFCRPSGLEVDPPRREDECYSSAYDIGRVMAYLLKNKDKYKELWKIMKTGELEITSKDGKITHELKNTDRLLKTNAYVLGAKTGFTPRAGFCLVAAGRNKNNTHQVIAVVFDDKDRFKDVERMISWAFENYNWY